MDKTDDTGIDALIDSGRVDEAVAALLTSSINRPNDAEPSRRLGVLLGTMGRMTEARVAFQRALKADASDLGALWGLYEVEQILGKPEAALDAQRRAVAISPVIAVGSAVRSPYVSPAEGPTSRRSVLMLCVEGGFQANTPLEYIVNGDHIQLHKWYLTGRAQPELPPYDVVFNAIGHARDVEDRLDEARRFIDAQPRESINDPQKVKLLARDALAATFAHSRTVHVVAAERVERAAVAAMRIESALVLRPINSQAGDDLVKIETAEERDGYLERLPDVDVFYRAPFVDYRSADGYFRKYRIAFVDGVAYPVHLAISPRWMVHYYNAPMSENAWMRAEEEAFMRSIDTVFDGDRAEALREIAACVPLEYFAVDCSVDRDGRVLLFEADTAMLVHLGDPIDLYPYKHSYIPRIIEALDRLFERKCLPRS